MFLGHSNRRNSEAYILYEEKHSLLCFFLFLRRWSSVIACWIDDEVMKLLTTNDHEWTI